MSHRLFVVCAFVLAACSGTGDVPPPPVADSDTSDEPNVLPLDSYEFVPTDTAPPPIPNIEPANSVLMRHRGTWELTGSPFTDVTGTLEVVEQINVAPYFEDTSTTADTAPPPPPNLCQVRYALTGQVVEGSTCKTCTVVADIEFVVQPAIDPDPKDKKGPPPSNPDDCFGLDLPQSGDVWQLGYDPTAQKILFNYFGTDVWTDWYDVPKGSAPPNLDFTWDFSIAIELEDTAMN